MKPNTNTWGVIDVAVVTDLTCNIEPVCSILLTEHSAATHFSEVTYTDGSTALYLYWSSCSNAHPLPFQLKTTSTLSHFIETWLEQNAVYGIDDNDGGDGSSNKGVRIATSPNEYAPVTAMANWYVMAVIEPTWVYYSK